MYKAKRGFTLIEVLVVVSILALLSVTGFLTLSKQKTKAEDTTMKTDLTRLKTAFEEYYNDHNCYPPEEWFVDASSITGDELRPYLNRMPINKKTAEPYILEKDATGCSWFKIYTTLNNPDDPQAVILRTSNPVLGSTLGNFGVSSANTRVSIYYESPLGSATPSPTPTPTSTPNPANQYYCSGINNCSYFDNTLFNCGPSYADPSCTGSNICATAGSCTPL